MRLATEGEQMTDGVTIRETQDFASLQTDGVTTWETQDFASLQTNGVTTWETQDFASLQTDGMTTRETQNFASLLARTVIILKNERKISKYLSHRDGTRIMAQL